MKSATAMAQAKTSGGLTTDPFREFERRMNRFF